MSLLHGLQSLVATAYDILGKEDFTHSTSPILMAYSRTPNSFQLFSRFSPVYPASNMSSTMVKRTKLFLIAYVHFAPFKYSTFWNCGILENRGSPITFSEERHYGPKFMYTSGSTDAPKCVHHSCASVGAVNVLLRHLTHEDSFLVYLPLVHALEYIVELSCVVRRSHDVFLYQNLSYHFTSAVAKS